MSKEKKRLPKSTLHFIGALAVQHKKKKAPEGHVILTDKLLENDVVEVLNIITDWKTSLDKLYVDLYREEFGE